MHPCLENMAQKLDASLSPPGSPRSDPEGEMIHRTMLQMYVFQLRKSWAKCRQKWNPHNINAKCVTRSPGTKLISSVLWKHCHITGQRMSTFWCHSHCEAPKRLWVFFRYAFEPKQGFLKMRGVQYRPATNQLDAWDTAFWAFYNKKFTDVSLWMVNYHW